MPLFQSFVAVDWSARSAPASGSDSIWIAVFDVGGDVELSNPTTRHAAESKVRSILAARRDVTTLVGIDVGLGYPAGTAALFDIDEPGEPAWRSTWRAIGNRLTDDGLNRNNRFEVAAELNRRSGAPAGPFWGHPRGRAWVGLAPTKPAAFSSGEFRATEHALRHAGRVPKSMWQLMGAGSVGGQTLTAIPMLERLRVDLGARLDVWPFTTGLRAPAAGPGRVVLAEVWPTMFDPTYPPGTIRDATQVAHVVRRLAEADMTNSLTTWFAPFGRAGAIDGAIVMEEGWVLGA